MTDGQWNVTFILNVDNDAKQLSESVIWVELKNPTGGALLASRDKTKTKIVIASNLKATLGKLILVIITVVASVASAMVLLAVVKP